MSNSDNNILSLCNKTKLLILKAIYLCNDNICGCDLVERLDIPKNLISYHIKTLRKAGFITEVKCGKNKRYEISKNKFNKVKELLKVLELI